MSELWPVTEEGTVMIRQNAVFNFKQLYKLFQTFALENEYRFNEKNFTRKDKSDGSEYQIEWTMERKVTPFIRFKIDVEIWSLRTEEIEPEKFKGEMEINFDAVMEMDYDDKKNWEKSKFTKFLRNVYIYYIKKDYFLGYASKLWEEVYELHARAKSVLNQYVP